MLKARLLCLVVLLAASFPGLAAELVSVDFAGTHASAGGSPFLSADGRFVAFLSGASDLVAGGTPGGGVGTLFVRDLHTGTTKGVKVRDESIIIYSISADGRYVATDRFCPIPPPNPPGRLPAQHSGRG